MNSIARRGIWLTVNCADIKVRQKVWGADHRAHRMAVRKRFITKLFLLSTMNLFASAWRMSMANSMRGEILFLHSCFTVQFYCISAQAIAFVAEGGSMRLGDESILLVILCQHPSPDRRRTEPQEHCHQLMEHKQRSAQDRDANRYRRRTPPVRSNCTTDQEQRKTVDEN